MIPVMPGLQQVALITYPGVDPVVFSVGPFQVHWYGLAYVMGFVVGGFVAYHLNRHWDVGLSVDDLVNLLLFAVLGVMLGGRLGYVLIYGGRYYLDEPLNIIKVWDGGMSFHGALVGVILAGLLYSHLFKVSFLRLGDMAAVAVPPGVFFGRLANFVNGELWGRPTDLPWAMVFPGAGPQSRHPSQLYEALLEGLVMFVVLWLLARHKRPDGFVFGWFMVLYGSFRFMVEFVRQPDPQMGFMFGWMTMGQILSLPLIVLGIWMVWQTSIRYRISDRAASSKDLPGQGT